MQKIKMSRGTLLTFEEGCNKSGNQKAVNSETYVAPEKDVITLQPINR